MDDKYQKLCKKLFYATRSYVTKIVINNITVKKTKLYPTQLEKYLLKSSNYCYYKPVNERQVYIS